LWSQAVENVQDRAIGACTNGRHQEVSVFEGLAIGHDGRIGLQKSWPSLQGPHNAQNVASAIATCEALGLAGKVISEGLRTYPGLPHRMERVAEKNGILFVNDSKATNPDSTAPALA